MLDSCCSEHPLSHGLNSPLRRNIIIFFHTQQLVDLEGRASSSDQELLGVVTARTEQIVATLRALVPADGGGRLTEQDVRGAGGSEATQQWLARVAIAEGLL